MKTKQKERWKDVGGYGGLYQVSCMGRIRSLVKSWVKDFMLKPSTTAGGYENVCLYKNGTPKGFYVHRLVCEAFHGLPTAIRNQTNHKNGNKTDNRSCNLEWCSGSENQRHSHDVRGNVGGKSGGLPVVGTHKETGEKIRFATTRIAVESGFNKGNICSSIGKHRKTAGGYYWKYETNLKKESKYVC